VGVSLLYAQRDIIPFFLSIDASNTLIPLPTQPHGQYFRRRPPFYPFESHPHPAHSHCPTQNDSPTFRLISTLTTRGRRDNNIDNPLLFLRQEPELEFIITKHSFGIASGTFESQIITSPFQALSLQQPHPKRNSPRPYYQTRSQTHSRSRPPPTKPCAYCIAYYRLTCQ
jgi:hypothetical protein